MSHKLISHSQDIKKLRDEGYEVEIRGSYLLVSGIPYVNNRKEITIGTLVTNVSIANNVVSKPNTHVIHFIGDFPCDMHGKPISQLKHQEKTFDLGNNIVANYSFSFKPKSGYSSYYEKITQYANTISSPATYLDNTVTAKTFKVIPYDEQESVFEYLDTNSSRANIDAINEKLSQLKVGIIGLGGTGSYILDFLSKTLVKEIQLFDNDSFFQHNAFRAPGAVSKEELAKPIKKVEYFKQIYQKLHRGIVCNDILINEGNLYKLKGLDFVFICIDSSDIKEEIFEFLEKNDISFIDTGMGLYASKGSLNGIIRTTLSDKTKREHVKNHVSFGDEVENDYKTNIQIAELNALNAIIAVIKFKKMYGFYTDTEKEYNISYTIDSNVIINDET